MNGVKHIVYELENYESRGNQKIGVSWCTQPAGGLVEKTASESAWRAFDFFPQNLFTLTPLSCSSSRVNKSHRRDFSPESAKREDTPFIVCSFPETLSSERR